MPSAPVASSVADLKQLRRQLRQQRRATSVRQQRTAGKAVLQHVQQHALLVAQQKIGIYLNAFGEVDTAPLINWCFKQHKQVYLPKVRHFDQKLLWLRVSRRQWQNYRFHRHSLGMQQPHHQRGIAVRQLDVLIMPLLGFDKTGTRLGMGGGFYDRTLAGGGLHPFRLGIAYDFQQVCHLPRNPWDQALDAVATPARLYHFKGNRHFFVF